ncbi:MAG: hypothetical protein AAGB00_06875 [Planctomycetota bacterium]
MCRPLIVACVASIGLTATAVDLVELEAAPPADSRAHALVQAPWSWEFDEPANGLFVARPPAPTGALSDEEAFDRFFFDGAFPITREVFGEAWRQPAVFTFSGSFMR